MDTNADGNVTAAEMTAAHPRVTGKKAQKTDLTAAEKIKLLDIDGDGALTSEEHAAGARSMFDKMDADKDGYLTKAELKAGHDKFLHKSSTPATQERHRRLTVAPTKGAVVKPLAWNAVPPRRLDRPAFRRRRRLGVLSMNDLSQRPRTDDTAWSELEQAFFAAAPPDDPEPAAEPMRFDDDTTPTPARVRARTRYLQTLSVVRSAAARLFAAIDGRRLDTKVMAAALAATVLVTALSTRAPSLAGGAARLQRCVFVAERSDVDRVRMRE